MQILVISDSHGSCASIKLLLDRYKNKVQTVAHLGDNATDLLKYQSQYPNLELIAVAGNCDSTSTAPKERILTLGTVAPRRILMLHGHSHNAKMSYDRLMYYAQEKEADACLFGHSHIPAVFVHGPVLFFNPGSVSEPRGMSRAGYGLITVDENGHITGEAVSL